MTELQKLFFESETQLKIFFKVLNTPKGITRTDLEKDLKIPWTTLYDNLVKLKKRKILTGPELNIEVPYIKTYTVKITSGVGRTCVLYFVAKIIRNRFMTFHLPEIKILGILGETIE